MFLRIKMTFMVALILSFVFQIGAAQAELVKTWELSGFAKPESVLFDQDRNVMYVSNLNGGGIEKNGKGFISKVSLEGKMLVLEWVKGLNAPKGLARQGNKLFVSDIDALVVIDIEKGIVLKKYPAAEAKFLNDVAINDMGHVFVSDMMTDTIWLLKDGVFSVWLKDSKIQAPNGLHVEKDRLVVAAWGVLTDGFKTETPGHMKVISFADKSIQSLGDGKSIGNLDGVEPDGKGNYYVTDWMNGKLFSITPKGVASLLLDLKPGSADLEYIADQKTVIIPQMTDHQIIAYQVK